MQLLFHLELVKTLHILYLAYFAIYCLLKYIGQAKFHLYQLCYLYMLHDSLMHYSS